MTFDGQLAAQRGLPDRGPRAVLPDRHLRAALLQTEQAKAVCRRCPVREQCLEWALETGQSIGVWGGTSETERRALKRRIAARRSSGRA